jgi:hypothetical protein
MNFCGDECATLYEAVRYYQINKTITDSKEYWKCDVILRKLYPYSLKNGLEPGFRSDV